MTFSDIFRIAIVTAAAVLALYCYYVVTLYFVTWKRTRVLSPNRLVSLHVWTVSISYSCFLVGAVIDVYQRIGDPMTFRVPLYATGIIFGTYGLVVLATSQSRKAQRIKQHTIPEQRKRQP